LVASSRKNIALTVQRVQYARCRAESESMACIIKG